MILIGEILRIWSKNSWNRNKVEYHGKRKVVDHFKLFISPPENKTFIQYSNIVIFSYEERSRKQYFCKNIEKYSEKLKYFEKKSNEVQTTLSLVNPGAKSFNKIEQSIESLDAEYKVDNFVFILNKDN